MTLQYNIFNGQRDRPTGTARASQWSLSGAIAGSLALHALAAAVALIASSGQGPVVDDAAITVFVEPQAAPVATASESKLPAEAAPEPPPAEPPAPPVPDFALPPPPEALAPPDFKTPPPPPPPRPAQAAPRPPQPKPAPARPAPAAPAEAAPSALAPAPAAAAPNAPSSIAPSIAPGWNALLAAWLAARKTYPDEARKRSEEGEVTVRFTVASGGRVGEVAVVKGSGFSALDAAALAMLRGGILPPPGVEVTRTVRIRFRLND